MIILFLVSTTSCTINTKLDLHVIDTSVATVKAYFQSMHGASRNTGLVPVLGLMIDRLKTAGPKRVDTDTVQEWCVFTDASYDAGAQESGLGAVLVGTTGDCAG